MVVLVSVSPLCTSELGLHKQGMAVRKNIHFLRKQKIAMSQLFWAKIKVSKCGCHAMGSRGVESRRACTCRSASAQ
jgi:hypothetical protein